MISILPFTILYTLYRNTASDESGWHPLSPSSKYATVSANTAINYNNRLYNISKEDSCYVILDLEFFVKSNSP